MGRVWTLLAALLLPSGVAGQGGAGRCTGAPAVAEAFAPELADSGRLYRASISLDGRTLYYFKKVTPGREDYRIFRSRRSGARWSPGERVDLGGDFSDLYPSLSKDGRRLVFASYRPAPGDSTGKPNAYLWYAERAGDMWGPPVFIPAAARFGHYHAGPVLQSDGSIYLHRTTPDWRTTTGAGVKWDGHTYVESEEPADPGEQWLDWRPGKFHVWGGQRAPSGGFAVLDVSAIDSATGRRGPPDVWVTRWSDGRWSEPAPAGGGVNTPGGENFLVFHPNGCEVLFTRNFSTFQRVGLHALLPPEPGP